MVKPSQVFINCPYRDSYEPVFQAVVFTIASLGLRARAGIEDTGADRYRLDRLVGLIRECELAIHDLSLGLLDSAAEPHLNMALELGIFLGHRAFSRLGRAKRCLILDDQPYRHWKSASDLGGLDAAVHGGSAEEAIRAVRNWLQPQLDLAAVPEAADIHRLFVQFTTDQPSIVRLLTRPTRTFGEYCFLVHEWLHRRTAGR